MDAMETKTKRRRRGRPTLSARDRRDHVVAVRLNVREYDLLKKKAKAAGRRLGRYLASLLVEEQ